MQKFIAILLTTILGILLIFTVPSLSKNSSEILWDTWGIPHIYAKNNTSLFQAFGWSQTKSHGNLLLKLYGQARGKAAEYWGINYLESDQYVRTMGIPKRAQQWYEEQTPEMRTYLDSFAQGINDYVQQHPDEIQEDLKQVLPVTGTDILGHFQRVIYFYFLTNPREIKALQNLPSQAGSNAWAIAPKKALNNHAILLANPHLPWSDFYLWYEAQLTAPDLNLYGATLVGMPALAIAFNDNLGWTFTFNPIDGADIYQLKLQEENYLFNGQLIPLKQEIETIKIRQPSGNFTELQIGIKRSIHGIIIEQQKDIGYALRVAGLDRSGSLEQLWNMGKAKNLNEFEISLKQLQLPLFNVIYADKKENIMYLFHGLIPIRSQGNWENWGGIIAGDTSETLWQNYHEYEQLPRLLNPKNGWLQNTNDPPWTSTDPPALKAEDFPPYFAPKYLGQVTDILRSQRSIELLNESDQLSLEDVINNKFSSKLLITDRLLDILISTTKALANPIGIEAAEVLEQWDRQTNPDSRGAVLFMLWATTLESKGLFSKPWNPENPLETPTGLADINTAVAVLEGIAAQVNLLYGSLDVPWGDVVRMRVGEQDVAARGGPGKLGSFQVLGIQAAPDKKFQVMSGDSFMMAVEFSDPIQAQGLTVYGNATQPDSSHRGDQLSLYQQGKMRPLWRDRSIIEQHLELRESF
ncbi:putative 7-beta-(4-carbaxybutanamido)cephalosporanic acid acylase [Crocosphaera subtropica ATCC 51142]|uniref:7-beta-(4-carbaxybutanamido)cephalosporanic acid acylase n=1 Tax=Crocosphaera subtropica (strain ATCC 51142 / BH68) TaxID=43989 RepID=B1WVG4_CROS5|nr:acylase [Crocosphaera subtropica]ACB53954.1 putative 7-beta-(4-carbaxybutanamido)cephalosporanic acid acylase [Crocosphaera subtropica ATCC 51142]